MIGGKKCYFYGDVEAPDILIQPVDAHDLELLDSEVALIEEGAKGKQFLLAAFLIEDWNRELSPWEAPPVFGKDGFGAGAEETLRFVTEELLPEMVKSDAVSLGMSLGNMDARQKAERKTICLGGYSLAGLFSLWAAYQTDLFQGIAAVSPSMWFPGWEQYIRAHEIRAEHIYLSLGEKETKTRNQVMAKVGEMIRLQHERLLESAVCRECVMEWNPGNHFVDSDKRTAKGFVWVLDRAGA
ncbi:MAG: esterase [Lachnospiraceae bacterium]|nr:esterase [Lachnospiraceae bacterium]